MLCVSEIIQEQVQLPAPARLKRVVRLLACYNFCGPYIADANAPASKRLPSLPLSSWKPETWVLMTAMT